MTKLMFILNLVVNLAHHKAVASQPYVGQLWINYTKRNWTRMCANAQRDGHRAERRWHPLFNAAKFG